MDAVIVDQHTLHLEVSSLTVLLVRKLDEGILQTVASLLIPDNFARKDLAKSREDQLEVLVSCNLVQFANKENLLWGCDIRER